MLKKDVLIKKEIKKQELINEFDKINPISKI